MVKQPLTGHDKMEGKIRRLEEIISSLESDVPLEGERWRSKMLIHYRKQLTRIQEALGGHTRSDSSPGDSL